MVNGPEGRRKLAGGACARGAAQLVCAPSVGRRTLRGAFLCRIGSGGSRHRLISFHPPGEKKCEPLT
jgi:hypothetical protein